MWANLRRVFLGGLDLTGKAAVLKTAGRKPVQVRVLCPPLSPVTPCGPGLIECARAHLPVLSRRHARSPAELERERRRDSGHRHGSPSADHGSVRAVDVSPCEGRGCFNSPPTQRPPQPRCVTRPSGMTTTCRPCERWPRCAGSVHRPAKRNVLDSTGRDSLGASTARNSPSLNITSSHSGEL